LKFRAARRNRGFEVARGDRRQIDSHVQGVPGLQINKRLEPPTQSEVVGSGAIFVSLKKAVG
jgi:hypothetical protein